MTMTAQTVGIVMLNIPEKSTKIFQTNTLFIVQQFNVTGIMCSRVAELYNETEFIAIKKKKKYNVELN